EYIRIDFEGPVIRQVLDHLAVRKLDSLLVEGGTQLINSFVEADVWDEARVETAPVRLYQGVHAPMLEKGVVRRVSRGSVMSIKNHNYEILNHNDEFEKS
ncbi:dihydrofolate reductase family protein, partial [Parabacteroides distasonis]|uniref:dihydrofolate reductase family protein n=2 Tax=Tannerellaceae TaxID=2005525 RepID=UPI0018AA46F0